MSTTDPSTWFAGFGDAPAAKGGNFIAPGVYTVTLLALTRLISNNHGTMGHQIGVIEVRVDTVEVGYPAELGPDGKALWSASNKAGERCSSIQNVTKHGKTALGNLKAVLLAALAVRLGRPDLTETALTPDQWEIAIKAATAPPGVATPIPAGLAPDVTAALKALVDVCGSLAGTRLKLYASKTRTRAGAPFTPLRWEPIAGGAGPTGA